MARQRNIIIGAVIGALLAGAGIGVAATNVGRSTDSAGTSLSVPVRTTVSGAPGGI